MKRRAMVCGLSAILMAAGIGVAAPREIPRKQADKAEKPKDDPISGDWNAIFEVETFKVPVEMKLKLKGNQVTGTVHSDHTGAGTVSNGTWSDQKLTLTFEFATHEAIAVSGSITNGKLSGDFATEGRTGKWTAETASGN